MPDQPETFRSCKVTIPVLILQIFVLMLFLPDFMNLGMNKIGCVNYAHFPKSGYIIYIYIYIYVTRHEKIGLCTHKF